MRSTLSFNFSGEVFLSNQKQKHFMNEILKAIMLEVKSVYQQQVQMTMENPEYP
jgi:hypothetical protein